MAWWSRNSRSDELLAEIRELRLRSERRDARTEYLLEQNRNEIQITREVIRRNEIAFQEFLRESAKARETLADLVKESRAQRGALLSLIDEMRGGGPNPATS